MANNVIGHVIGQDKKVLDNMETVDDVRQALGLDDSFAGSINGESFDGNTELEDSDYVTFTKKVKGGLV